MWPPLTLNWVPCLLSSHFSLLFWYFHYLKLLGWWFVSPACFCTCNSCCPQCFSWNLPCTPFTSTFPGTEFVRCPSHLFHRSLMRGHHSTYHSFHHPSLGWRVVEARKWASHKYPWIKPLLYECMKPSDPSLISSTSRTGIPSLICWETGTQTPVPDCEIAIRIRYTSSVKGELRTQLSILASCDPFS